VILRIIEAPIKSAVPLQVDRANGVIEGVKILGASSANGRYYTPEAMRRAIDAGLYEDAKVYLDHPSAGEKFRPVEQLFGKIRNARLNGDSIIGDLYFVREHPVAPRVCEDCERALGLFGLSHNAEAAQWEVRDGVQVITEIAKVYSVDLVSDPATNSSLWEARPITRIKFAELLDRLSADRKLPKRVRRRLLEVDGDMPAASAELPEPEPETDPMDALKDGFRAAIMAAVDQALDGDEEALKQVVELIKTHRKVTAGQEEPPAADDQMASDDGEPADDQAEQKESRNRPAAGLTEARAAALVKIAGVEDPDTLVKAVAGLNEEQALRVLAWAKERASNSRPGGARSQGVRESVRLITDGKTLAEAILN
jgi:hypothetical protein